MRTIQKLELFFGATTLISAGIEFYIDGIPQIKRIANLNGSTSIEEAIAGAFLFLLLPAMLTFFGAYTHTIWQSRLGFISLLIGGGVLVLIVGIGLFSGAIFYSHGFPQGLLIAVPHFAALITLVSAIYFRKLYMKRVVTRSMDANFTTR